MTIKIKSLPNKESFGYDEISYGILKKVRRWVEEEMTDIFNLSIRTGIFPKAWRIGKVKPLYKGQQADKTAPKSYRPVCLLSAASRVLEGMLASQIDKHAEGAGINHRGIHGYRAGRGCATAILEFQEDLIFSVEEGSLLALALLDVSAGFDSVPAINLLRKLQIGFGYGPRTLRWLISYLTDRVTYIAVEASRSRSRKMGKGVPQGGPLCPALWRSYLAELPEAGKVWWGSLGKVLREMAEEQQAGGGGAAGDGGPVGERAPPPAPHQGAAQAAGAGGEEDGGDEGRNQERCPLSQMVDNKSEEEMTAEERFDQKMRREEVWRISEWVKERRSGTRAVEAETPQGPRGPNHDFVR